MSCFGSSRQGCVTAPYCGDDIMAPPRPSLSASRPSTPKVTLRVVFNSKASPDQCIDRKVPVRDAKFYRQLEKAKDEREASIKRKRASHPHLRAEYRDQSPPPLPACSIPSSPTSSISSTSSSLLQPARKRLLRKRSEPVLAARTTAAIGGATTHFEELPPVPKIPAMFWDVNVVGPREQTITVVKARLITCS